MILETVENQPLLWSKNHKSVLIHFKNCFNGVDNLCVESKPIESFMVKKLLTC